MRKCCHQVPEVPHGPGKRAKVTTKQIRKGRRETANSGVKPSVYIETTIPSLLTAWPSRDVEIAAQQMQRGNGGKTGGKISSYSYRRSP